MKKNYKIKKSYYIAYGSNLNAEQMKRRCPDARAIGTATLIGWELLFRGSKTGAYLTIEQNKAENTPVAVWEISEKDEIALDRYEGYPTFYYKRFYTLEVELNNGEKTTVRAFAYIMHEDRPLGIPTKFYLETCLDGYSDFGFNDLPLRAAYKKSLEVCGNGR